MLSQANTYQPGAPVSVEEIAKKYLEAAFKATTAEEQTTQFEALEEQLDNQEKLIETLEQKFMQLLPQDISWIKRRQILLELAHPAKDKPEEKSDLSPIEKKGIQGLLQLQQKYRPKKDYSLGDLAIIDRLTLAEKFHQLLIQIKKEDQTIFAAALTPLNLATYDIDATKNTDIRIVESSVLEEHQEKWLNAVRKILGVGEIEKDKTIPLLELEVAENKIRIEALACFIALTLCAPENLGLTDVRTNDIDVLKRLCEMYLTTDKLGEMEKAVTIVVDNEGENVVTLVEGIRKNGLQAGLYMLVMHLSVMISNLSLFKDQFNLGFVRILDRATAIKEIEKEKSTVIRMGLGSGGRLVVTHYEEPNKLVHNIIQQKEDQHYPIKFSEKYHFLNLSSAKTYTSCIANPDDKKMTAYFNEISPSKTIVSYEMFKNTQEKMKEIRQQQGCGYNIKIKEIEARFRIVSPLEEKQKPSFHSPTTAVGDEYALLLKKIDKVELSESQKKPILSALESRDYNLALRRACNVDNSALQVVNAMLEAKKLFTLEVINKQDEQGQTVLHTVISNPGLWDILIKQGANKDIKDNYGESPNAEMQQWVVLEP